MWFGESELESKKKKKREKSLKDKTSNDAKIVVWVPSHGAIQSSSTVHTHKISKKNTNEKGEGHSSKRSTTDIVMKKSSKQKLYESAPIPIEFQEPGFIYCMKCPAHYRSKYQLRKHW